MNGLGMWGIGLLIALILLAICGKMEGQKKSAIFLVSAVSVAMITASLWMVYL